MLSEDIVDNKTKLTLPPRAPNTTKRSMPTELAIRKHWVDRLWRQKGYDSAEEFVGCRTCFACGLDGNERAHIVARAVGGGDELENLHILCWVCHKDSEHLEGSRYMNWLLQRSPVDRIVSHAVRNGFNASVLMLPDVLYSEMVRVTYSDGCRANLL
jgi:hypothetical protein